MLKQFLNWIHVKIKIDKREKRPVIHIGEVYWCVAGENIGDEENGKGIFLTTSLKNNTYYQKIKLQGFERSVIISQLRLLDSKRLYEKIGNLSKEDFEIIKKRIIEIIRDSIF